MNRTANRSSRNGHVKSFYVGAGSTSLDTILQSLAGVNLPERIKARDPISWHPWVFSAAIAVATTASSAPFSIFVETEDQMDARARRAKSLKRPWRGPESGSRRRAVQRHIRVPIHQRLRAKGLEPDETNPLWDVLSRPNPHMMGNQLFWCLHFTLSYRQHSFWVLTDENGDDPAPGEVPARIWPVSPTQMEPILEHGYWGEQIGWWLCPSILMRARERGTRVPLPLSSVIEFKLPHPDNLLQAVSRLSPIAEDIEDDLGLKAYNRAIVKNGGDPGGLLMFDGTMTQEEEKDALLSWNQRHEGPQKANKTALLSAGMKYAPIALTSVDLQGMENMEWNRAAELAAMGVPPSQIGLTEFTNYATALGQKSNFWDNTILPQINLVDTVIDQTLMFDQPDNVVGMHDLRDVEALRSGNAEKIEAAVKLAGTELHAPPRVAYEVVGLEVPEYEGDDEAGAPPPPPPPPGADDPETDPNADPEEEEPEDTTDDDDMRARTKTRADDFIAVQSPWEESMRRRYTSWVSSEKRAALARFDDAVMSRGTKQSVNLDDVIPNLQVSQQSLAVRVRPLYAGMLDTTFEFTVEDFGGVAIFALEETAVFEIMEARQAALLKGPPVTVRNALTKTLTQGITEGESIQQLRQRVGEVYGVAGSSSRALMVARTETSGFMNNARFAMFDAQGIEKKTWITAGDENVREDHVRLGRAAAKPMDFDYMELLGSGGFGQQLHYPHDPGAPASQVVNCRCTLGAA